MHGEIVFYTHGSTIEYSGKIFPAGELTANILNFAPEDYPPIQRFLDRMVAVLQTADSPLPVIRR